MKTLEVDTSINSDELFSIVSRYLTEIFGSKAVVTDIRHYTGSQQEPADDWKISFELMLDQES